MAHTGGLHQLAQAMRTTPNFGRDKELAVWLLLALCARRMVMLSARWGCPVGRAGYEGSPRYNLDGTPKRKKSPSFFTLDLRGEYTFSKTLSMYLGADNLLNYKQSDKDSQLFVDGQGTPDVVNLWGPNRGRYVYAGIKVSY